MLFPRVLLPDGYDPEFPENLGKLASSLNLMLPGTDFTPASQCHE